MLDQSGGQQKAAERRRVGRERKNKGTKKRPTKHNIKGKGKFC